MIIKINKMRTANRIYMKMKNSKTGITSLYLLLLSLFIIAAAGHGFVERENNSSKDEPVSEKEKDKQINKQHPIQKNEEDNSVFSFSSVSKNNFRVFPSNNNQTETPIVIHPWNPDVILASSIVSNEIIRGYFSGSYVSRDGGRTWSGKDYLSDYKGSLVYTVGDPSIVIDKNGTFVISYIAPPVSPVMAEIGSSYSTDYGMTWSKTVYVPRNSVYRADKLFSTTDINSQSNFYGRTYLAYSETNADNPLGKGIMLSYSNNNGKSWSQPIRVSPVSTIYDFSCDLKTYNGKVYIAWMHSTTWLGFGVSTDGGVSFNSNGNSEQMNNVGVINYTSALTNGLPRMDVDANGVVYVVTTEIYDDDADIILHRTDDEGATWSKVKVNQNTDFDCKYQFQPAIRVDEQGGINVLYYDSRNTATSDSLEMYISRSTDGGESFMDFLVSDHKFKNTPPGYLFDREDYLGSYIGITSGNNKLYPYWFDNSTGYYQAWTNIISLDSIPPQIFHHKFLNTGNLSGPYEIECNIRKGSSTYDPAEVKLLWSRNNVTITDSTLMQKVNEIYTGQIPGNDTESFYKYYIKVTDSLGLNVASPEHAPVDFNTFAAANDFVKPVINHVSPVVSPLVLWPARLIAEVSDTSGIEYVRVDWFKNTGDSVKTFYLLNTTGNTYTALFNSDISDVTAGDRIYYSISAKDNSFMQNISTTGTFTMRITAEIPVLCENFTGDAFPPDAWGLEFTDSCYWIRSFTGSYNSGLGSAEFDFYNAPASTTQSLISSVYNFYSGDKLFMDYAYAPNLGTDSLIIETSSNSGITFQRFFGMAGGENGDSLNTAPSTNVPFLPDSTQWKTLVLHNLPAESNRIRLTARSGNGGNNLYLDNICIKNIIDPDTFSVKVIIQGLFDAKNLNLLTSDTLRCYLRNFHFPYNLVDSAVSISYDQASFESKFIFKNAQSGSYYIVIKQRNSIETWSTAGITYIRGEEFSYDFTDSEIKAYGNNLIFIEPYYCIYSGDINQDGTINSNDLLKVLNDYSNNLTGYQPSDVNGNNVVDFDDVLIVFYNSNNFISRKSPRLL